MPWEGELGKERLKNEVKKRKLNVEEKQKTKGKKTRKEQRWKEGMNE